MNYVNNQSINHDNIESKINGLERKRRVSNCSQSVFSAFKGMSIVNIIIQSNTELRTKDEI